MTRLVGVSELQPDLLRRIWACCPPDQVTYLEAAGVENVTALGEYLLAHPNFSSLRSLRLSGTGARGSTSTTSRPMNEMWRALELGHAPGLHEMGLDFWDGAGGGWVGLLASVIGQGKLPELSSLDFYNCYSGDDSFRALVDGLQMAAGLRLRQLHLGGCSLSDDEMKYLTGAIKAGGGLTHLEEFSGSRGGSAIIMEPLAHGAPCARTLRSLDMHVSDRTRAHTLAILAAWGNGAIFSSLT